MVGLIIINTIAILLFLVVHYHLSSHRFLQHLVMPNNPGLCMGSDYRIALLCNAYSTNQEYFTRPMAALVDTILGKKRNFFIP